MVSVSGRSTGGCEASGTRIVVFEVSGIIELKEELIIRNPYITIAGQTSPKGITLTNKGFAIQTDHIVVRHLRVRLGILSNKKKTVSKYCELTMSSLIMSLQVGVLMKLFLYQIAI